ncbi:unnamed protein product [Caenorhabditis bovis]|uniref:Receptor L-domain domain-containing protein n=1 Tax=Caenorhabditis bovis TaxID=2654633 RepID=A0A8S1EXX2_9PELO|nr:unnamed protein product [Caenorhabditis bovis]
MAFVISSKLFIVLVVLFQFFTSSQLKECVCALCRIDTLPDNCTEIDGHIQIGLESEMPPFELIEFKLKKLAKLTGCLLIANSGLTSLKFLSNLRTVIYAQTGNSETCSVYGNAITLAKNNLLRRLYLDSLEEIDVTRGADYGLYISLNPSLCITEKEVEIFFNTSRFYAPHMNICDPTRMYCALDTQGFFDDTNIQEGCQVLTDSLVLNGSTPNTSEQFQNRLNDIEQIFGSIIVLNTKLTSLKFPKLWRIYNFQQRSISWRSS